MKLFCQELEVGYCNNVSLMKPGIIEAVNVILEYRFFLLGTLRSA